MTYLGIIRRRECCVESKHFRASKVVTTLEALGQFNVENAFVVDDLV